LIEAAIGHRERRPEGEMVDLDLLTRARGVG